MPNGEPFTTSFPTLQQEYEAELATVERTYQERYQLLSPAEKIKPEVIAEFEVQKRQAIGVLTSKYQRISSTMELRQAFEAGELPELYIGQAEEYVKWREDEVWLIRMELRLGTLIRRQLELMEAVGKPTVLTKIGQFFYKQFGPLFGQEDPRAAGVYEQTLKEYNANVERLGQISDDIVKVVTYQSLYEGLAAYIQSGKVITYDDLFTLTNNEGKPITRFQELGYDDTDLRDIFNKIAAAVANVPEDMELTDKNYADIIAHLAKRPELAVAPVTIQSLTTKEIIKALQTAVIVMPTWPSGIASIEEASKIYQEAGVPPELVEELESLESFTDELESYWEALSASQEAVVLGLEQARMPEMGVGDILLQTIQQPALTALDVFSKLYTEWIAPWGAFLYRMKYTYTRLPGLGLTSREREFQRVYEEALKTDDWWHAGGKAFAEVELGFLDRLVFEWIADPITWLGLGVMTKAATRIPVVGARFLGPSVGLVERGWLKAWDVLIFDRIKNAGRFIAKTPMQGAINYAGKDMTIVGKYLVAASKGKYYRKIPLLDAQESLRRTRSWAILHPEDTGLMAAAGRALLRTSTIDEKMVLDLGRRLGTELEITKEMILNVSSQVNSQIAGIGIPILSKKAAPAFLLRTLGIAESPKALKAAAREINRLKRLAVTTSDDIITKADNVPDLLSRIFSHSQDVYFTTVQSVAAHNLEMSGRMASIFSRVNWKVMNTWRNSIDKWFVTPPARMYLAFSAYGPGNILEGFFKTLLARQSPFWKFWGKNKPITVVNPTARGQRLMAGLSKPMELEFAIARIEMAGETPTFRAIEQMSKNLKIWRSVLSGGPIGRFFIDLPGKVGVHQRWNYYRQMFITFLGEEEATVVMSALARNIDDAVRGLSDDMLHTLNLSRHELKTEMFERAIAGPNNVRNLLDDIVADRIMMEKGVSKNIAMADRISGGRVAEAIGKYELIPDQFTDDLITKASDGSLWSKGGKVIGETIEGYKAGMYDYFVHTPEFYKKRMGERVDEILGLEIRNKEEFTGVMQELQDLQRFYASSTDDVIRAMNELETEMSKRMKYYDWNEWRGKYSREVYEGLADYGDLALKNFRKLIKKLEGERSKYLTIGEQDSVAGLVQRWVDEQRYLIDFWKKRKAEEIAEIAAMPLKGAARSESWAKFRANQEAAHLKRVERQSWFRDMELEHGDLTSIALGTISDPSLPIIDVIGRKLAKLDVATLFHAHPSQLPTSMLRLETMTLKSKGQFITEVRSKARRMARQVGKTPEALGWTDDAIGEVYDYVLRDMYMSPKSASVLEPHLMELKALQDEIWSIYNTKAIPEGMADVLQRFADDLAKVLEDIPGYATPKMARPGVLEYYRGGALRKVTGRTATEGEGLYVSRSREFAEGFGEVSEVGIMRPKNPLKLIAGDELPSIGGTVKKTTGTPWLEEAIKPGDSPWTRLNKKAAKDVGYNADNPTAFNRRLDELLREEGYDAVSVTKSIAGDDYLVLLDESLWKPTKIPVRELSDDFQSAKQRAADKSSKEYYKDFADYTNENITTAVMRGIYPFWTYELHRLFWLPRASIRTPGIFKGWGTYMDATEDGYVHIPGTSLEFNPLRGTIFMGGMLRLIRKDYPEYYDMFPALSESFDWFSRFGFYPAAYLNFLKLFGGTSASGRPQFGELLPAWVKTPLNAYIAMFPDSAPAKFLLNTLLPEPFRNYMTIQVANAICQREQKTFNGMEIWDKLQENDELNDEEQEVWTRATQQYGWMGMIMEQAAVLRIRTEEQLAAWEASGNLIEEKTGYTKEMQLWIRQHGFRVGDYAQLDVLDQALLGEMDSMKYHAGVFSSLMPTAWQEEDRRRREFYRAYREYDDGLRLNQEELDRLVRAGEITVGQWDRARSDLRGRAANYFTDLSETERYRNIALELEDIVRPDGTIREGLISRAAKREQLPPTQHPSDELLNAYYSIKLERKFDQESGKYIDDWDGYFLKIDIIIKTLDGAERDDFIAMITRKMTDLERLRWDISKKYFRGYNRRQEAILRTQFTPEQQVIIKQWIFGSPVQRDELQEVIDETTGRKLIALYRDMIRQTGQNLRMLSPELDAWLRFWEVTDTALTDQAAQLYLEYRQNWGIPP